MPAREAGAEAPASPRLYSPYSGLAGGAFDPALSRTLLELPAAPEFVFSEEALQPRRSWSENLTFITGAAYGGGALAGGSVGALRGSRAALPAGAGPKLRLNRLLNTGGQAGRAAGNAAGVAGLLYSGLDSAAGWARGTHDGANTVLAAAGTGGLYMAPSGGRAAAVWAAGGALAGLAAAGGQALVERLV